MDTTFIGTIVVDGGLTYLPGERGECAMCDSTNTTTVLWGSPHVKAEQQCHDCGDYGVVEYDGYGGRIRPYFVSL